MTSSQLVGLLILLALTAGFGVFVVRTIRRSRTMATEKPPAVPPQLQNRIADDVFLLVTDRQRANAHRRAVAFTRAASAATDENTVAAYEKQAAEFEHFAKMVGALTDPDKIP